MKRAHHRLEAFQRPARVSVVIPCYNYARYLPQSVGSALAQEDVDVDVVIVDDASTDDSVAVAERFASTDPRVRLVRHERNRGHVETSNEALGLATAEFMVKLDADDLLTPGSLARAAALMSRHPEVVLTYGFPHRFRGEPPRDVPTQVRSWSIWSGEEWLRKVLGHGHNVIMQPEVMLRRSAVHASGGYRPQLRWAEDYNLWLRLATVGSIGRVNGPTQGLYRVHDASFQRSSSNDIELTDLKARISAVELFFAECGERLRDHQRMSDLAFAALARDARRLLACAAERGRDSAADEFADLAVRLERRLAGAPSRAVFAGLLARRGALGRACRDLAGRVNWHRWARYGI